jgi:hypothetical protein
MNAWWSLSKEGPGSESHYDAAVPPRTTLTAVAAWARQQKLAAGLDGPRPALAGATDGPARCSIAGALGPSPASTNLSCIEDTSPGQS